MREQHLSKGGSQQAFFLINADGDIFQGKPLQLFHLASIRKDSVKRNQCRGSFRHLQSCLFCHAVAIAGGTGRRVGNPAGRHDHRICILSSAVHKNHAGAALAIKKEFLHRSIQINLYSQTFQFFLQGADHIRGLVRFREYTVPALCLQAKPLCL